MCGTSATRSPMSTRIRAGGTFKSECPRFRFSRAYFRMTRGIWESFHWIWRKILVIGVIKNPGKSQKKITWALFVIKNFSWYQWFVLSPYHLISYHSLLFSCLVWFAQIDEYSIFMESHLIFHFWKYWKYHFIAIMPHTLKIIFLFFSLQHQAFTEEYQCPCPEVGVIDQAGIQKSEYGRYLANRVTTAPKVTVNRRCEIFADVTGMDIDNHLLMAFRDGKPPIFVSSKG